MIRTELREHIFKMLYQVEFHGAEEMQEPLRLYLDALGHATEDDKAYMQNKYGAVAGRLPEIDKLLNENTQGWKTKRMNKVDLAILRLAVYEMAWDEDIPTKVAINEAVELAKRFGGDDSPSFVNGVLGKVARGDDVTGD
ncbi:MAG: transcription antitermination factor NusB [Ruminococcus sp.]|nr:transcription antitermination factor NusB [Ruminococcus sp.]